jgi:hypothetical protein
MPVTLTTIVGLAKKKVSGSGRVVISVGFSAARRTELDTPSSGLFFRTEALGFHGQGLGLK